MEQARGGRRLAAVVGVVALFAAGLVLARIEDSSTAPPGTGDGYYSGQARAMVRAALSLDSFAVSPVDPDVRASVWDICPILGPCPDRWGMAVTADGFTTARYFLVIATARPQWAGGDWFATVLANGQAALISPTGGYRIVPVSQTPAPARSGELLVHTFPNHNGVRTVAIDPVQGTGHVVPGPPGVEGAVDELGQDLLVGSRNDHIIISSDGGGTWRTHSDLPPAEFDAPVLSDSPQLDAFLSGGNDPLDPLRFVRSTDDGATWSAVDTPSLPTTWPAWSAITPAGGLLVMYTARSLDGGAPRLYQSDSSTWTSFHSLPVRRPPGVSLEGYLTSMTTPAGGQTLFVQGDSSVAASSDQGRSWSTIRDR